MAEARKVVPSQAWRIGLVLAVVGILLACAWGWRRWPKASGVAENDARLSQATAYRNVDPDVKYVGDAVCARCHKKLAHTFQQHSMGRSLLPTASASAIERYEPSALNPFVADNLHYRVERRQAGVWHHEWSADPQGRVLVDMAAEVHYALGSGKRGRAYLVNRLGYLFQSPITWYPEHGRWDLAPSYDVQNQHFGRPITPGCLFCHANHAEHIAGTLNRYREPIFQGHAIGCERCHGPGELHVQRRTHEAVADGIDNTIVNPARLEHALREAVCQQCHLQGGQQVLARGRSDFDFRPGLPLHWFRMDFVRNRPDDAKFVGTVEQMYASRCYRASEGRNKLGCISCHDPHQLPAANQKVDFYRRRCLQCHSEASCGLALDVRRKNSKDDSCMACHMPRSGSDVSHASITDHRVPRRPEAAKPTAARGRIANPPYVPFSDPAELVPFQHDLLDGNDEEASRNLGVALLGLLQQNPPAAVAHKLVDRGLPLLERALERDRGDWPAWHAKADGLWILGRREEALAAYETVLAGQPEREASLYAAASSALAMRRLDAARSYAKRAIQVNPWNWQYYHLLAAADFQQQEWNRAERACLQSLRLEVNNPASRQLLVACYLRLGHKDRAQAQFQILLQSTPEKRRLELRRWYDAQATASKSE